MTREFLLEIGVEELPASFVAGALEAMPVIAKKLLDAARITYGDMRSIGTPRRLTLIIDAVAEKQSDISELVQGPAKSIAVGADGKLSKAGEAFVKKLGKAESDVQFVTTPKGEYIAVQRDEAGRATSEVLPALISELCAQIPFQKSMRWGEGDYAFGRPVHWLVALFGADVVTTSFAGAKSGRTTVGHRFLHTAPVSIASPSDYVATLRNAHVLADPAERRRVMYERLLEAARQAGGTLIEDEFLMNECLSLVEEPHVVIGSFEETFLSLPDEVIVAVMRGHQRYFAIKNDATGRLLPAYLTVVNTANDPTTIKRGNDRVLRARLADARFFVDEDRKTSLPDRAQKLGGIVFQTKLGTVAEKVARVSALAKHIAETTRAADPQRALEAAMLAKADLVSLIVGEFPELQGIMGRHYALEQNIDAGVADAIRDHYAPKGASDSVPSAALSAIVSISDRIDTLVGCFGIGLSPTGSADPFALRRAVLGVLRIALEGPVDVDLPATFNHAYALFVGKPLAPQTDVVKKLDDFARGRLRALFSEKHATHVVDACLAAWNGKSVRDFDARVRAVSKFVSLAEFESLATAFKRCHNITKDVASGDFELSKMTDAAERSLAEAFTSFEPRFAALVAKGAYTEALELVASVLRSPIDTFFKDVFVMVDDLGVRENRLRMLRRIADTINSVAHVHLLEGGGST